MVDAYTEIILGVIGILTGIMAYKRRIKWGAHYKSVFFGFGKDLFWEHFSSRVVCPFGIAVGLGMLISGITALIKYL